jgi:hypothetical protein
MKDKKNLVAPTIGARGIKKDWGEEDRSIQNITDGGDI